MTGLNSNVQDLGIGGWGNGGGDFPFEGKIYQVYARAGLTVPDPVAFDITLADAQTSPNTWASGYGTATNHRATTGRKLVAVDQAKLLLGVDDRLWLGDDSAFDFDAVTDCTVVFWGVLYDLGVATVLVGKKSDLTTSAGWALHHTALDETAFVAADGVDSAENKHDSSISAGVAFLIAGDRDAGTDVATWIDGTEVTTPTAATLVGDTSNALDIYVGAQDDIGTNNMDGEFIAVTIFDKLLTPAEHTQLASELNGTYRAPRTSGRGPLLLLLRRF
jgi:hypothetical protein